MVSVRSAVQVQPQPCRPIPLTSFNWMIQDVPPRSTIVNRVISEHKFNSLKLINGTIQAVQYMWELGTQSQSADGIFKVLINMKIHHPYLVTQLLQPSYCEVQTFVKGIFYSKMHLTLKQHLISSDPPAIRSRWVYEFSGKSSVWDESVDTLNVKVVMNLQSQPTGAVIHWPTGATNPPMTMNKATPIGKDMKKYFNTSSLSDVTIVAKNVEFHAHRLILSARSVVFERMFAHEMKETKEGRVSIDDVEPHVFNELLHYMYTDDLSTVSISNDIAVEILKAADKYGIEDLKMLCASQIAEGVTLENAVELYAVGDTFNVPLILRKVVKVMKRDKAKAFKNPIMLRNITNQFPKLAFELMTA